MISVRQFEGGDAQELADVMLEMVDFYGSPTGLRGIARRTSQPRANRSRRVIARAPTPEHRAPVGPAPPAS
jgi:hypothetical protein